MHKKAIEIVDIFDGLECGDLLEACAIAIGSTMTAQIDPKEWVDILERFAVRAMDTAKITSKLTSDTPRPRRPLDS